ncbi:MAG TPA: 1-(5-phosphoribosyl)-5-amino-4-imidazole-carboxylate carboxylase, partial [Actinomycetota bacterium]|nr:1-(5-phosphoribosyl)-5-amino-4-imidazole-carboxylate carboxylase [Actinomycetota bacterium]
MDEGRLRQLLGAVASGELSTEDAVTRLAAFPFEDLGFARVDHHRVLRGGPEVVYGAGKTPAETASIVAALLAQDAAPVLVTKATAEHAAAVREAAPDARWHPRSGMLVCRAVERDGTRPGLVGVVCAGTSDLPVAEEAWVTAEAFGCRVDTLVDVGVAGAHRLFAEAG